MSAKKDNVLSFYDVLEVKETATQEEIRRSYRRLALLHHPDKNPTDRAGAEARFKKISEAFSILNDPEARRKYDNRNNSSASGSFAFHDDFDANSIFRAFFGGRSPFDNDHAGFGNSNFGFGGFGGFPSMFGSMFGSMGSFGSSQQSRAGGRGFFAGFEDDFSGFGGGGSTFFSSSSFSSSSGGGGMSSTSRITTTTTDSNGRPVKRTVTRVQHADGRVEEHTQEQPLALPASGSRAIPVTDSSAQRRLPMPADAAVASFQSSAPPAARMQAQPVSSPHARSQSRSSNRGGGRADMAIDDEDDEEDLEMEEGDDYEDEFFDDDQVDAASSPSAELERLPPQPQPQPQQQSQLQQTRQSRWDVSADDIARSQQKVDAAQVSNRIDKKPAPSSKSPSSSQTSLAAAARQSAQPSGPAARKPAALSTTNHSPQPRARASPPRVNLTTTAFAKSPSSRSPPRQPVAAAAASSHAHRQSPPRYQAPNRQSSTPAQRPAASAISGNRVSKHL